MKKKITVFTVVLLLLSVLISAVLYTNKSYAETSEQEQETDDKLKLGIGWGDSKFKNGSDLSIVEESSVSNTVKIRVSYSSTKIREEGYDAGELIIMVKGVGGVNRSGTLQAVVGADKESNPNKERDWSYTWNKASDTYTLTNNERIKPNSVFSGYFDLVYDVDARGSIHGYEQNDITAQVLLPDGDSVTSNTLTFSNRTKADLFAVDIENRVLYSYEGLTKNISNPEDYVFIKYYLGNASLQYNSRGLNTAVAGSPSFIFDANGTSDDDSPIVISPNCSARKLGNGAYKVGLSYEGYSRYEYIYVAYPKESYSGNTVSATLEMQGTYYEGDDSGNLDISLLAQDSVDVLIPVDFTFTDIPGGINTFEKYSWYDLYGNWDLITQKGGEIKGTNMVTSTTERFYLRGSLNVSSGKSYSLELVDDFLYITQKDGNYRQLVAGDYDYNQVIIPNVNNLRNINGQPLQSDIYPVKVYAMQDGAGLLEDETTLIFDGLLTNREQAVKFPSGTTCIAIVLENIEESIQQFTVPIDVNFHLEEEGRPENEQADLTTGKVVNTSFLRVYDKEGNWINNGFTQEQYHTGWINLDLAQKDMDLYGAYLDREDACISFYEADKSDYNATTSLDSIRYEEGRYQTTFHMGAYFNFNEEEIPDQFSLYTILPQAFLLTNYGEIEDIWDNMTLSGMGLDTSLLASSCTPEVITNFQGSQKTFIALHFNLEGYDIAQDASLSAAFSITIPKKYMKNNKTSFNVKSAVMMDKDVNAFTLHKYKDNGRWDFDADLAYDLNNNGSEDDLLSFDYDYAQYIYAESSQYQLTKYVKTNKVSDYVQLPNVPLTEYGSDYTYKLELKNGSCITKDIVFKDILESGPNMQWQGNLKDIQVEGTDTAVTIWYSESADPGVVGGSGWSTDLSPTDAKAVAIDFGDFKLKEGQTLAVLLTMTAPIDDTYREQITENAFSAAATMIDSVSGLVTKSDRLESNYVQVELTPPLKRIIITKEDEVNGVKLDGAQFELKEKGSDEVIATATSNAKGYAIFRNIPIDLDYVVTETVPPQGYMTAEDVEVHFSGIEDFRITVKDPRVKGKIEIEKVNALDDTIPVAGAQYTLYDEEDNPILTATTGDDGKVVYENLEWGNYTICETKAPDGYLINSEELFIGISRMNVETVQTIKVSDEQEPDVLLNIVKYEQLTDGTQTQEPLPGCVFKLSRKLADGTTKTLGRYVSDSNGLIQLGPDIPYGDYILQETRMPAGYNKANDTEFTLSPENRQINLNIYNERKAAKILLFKRDDIGNMVTGAVFKLYDSTQANELGEYTTDEYGNIDIDNLEWGTYFLKEAAAPEGYEVDLDWHEIVVDATHLQPSITIIDKTKKGSVVLTKTDEIGKNKLAGAEYALYKKDGTLLQKDLVTDESGDITVNDLPWGSYYFKETKAPTGYGLSDETIRFSINYKNAGLVQYLTAVDPLSAKSITLTKKLKASEINFENGNPTFLFKLFGTDLNGEEHTYYRICVFNENYVIANTDADGYVSQTVIFSGMPAGNYEAVEEESSRYTLKSIENVTETKAASSETGEGSGGNTSENPESGGTSAENAESGGTEVDSGTQTE